MFNMSDKTKSKSKQCEECRTTESQKFHSLKNEKWSQAERNGLVKVTWKDGIILCHKCYMNLVENLLQIIKKGTKRVRVTVEEAGNEIEATRETEEIQVEEEEEIQVEEEVEFVNENKEDAIIREEIEAIIRKNVINEELESADEEDIDFTAKKDVDAIDEEEIRMINLVEVIKAMARIFYEREHIQKEGPLYLFDEMRELLPQIDSSLKDFFDQLYLLARPFQHCEKTMGRMKKLMVFLCYLLVSLNNSKINSFKFDLVYYLDSVGTSNEGLNTLANIGITTTARAVDHKKRQFSAAHGEYVEKVLVNCLENALVLNVDDYHNVHVQRQPDTTSTSWAAHMVTIIANPCPISAIPRNGALNPKIVDDELILNHLDKRFIVNLGISYHDRRQNYIALQIVYNQRPMQEYLSNNAIPIVVDWPRQFFIRKAIAYWLLLNNELIPLFIMAFVPMMGPLHIFLNSRELVFKKNSFLFNEVYKSIFGKKKKLGKKPRPWRIDLMLHVMHMAWLDISNIVFSKFGRTCKNLEFLYLTDLLSNLIPLVLDVYAVHHQEGNWPAYEEACMRCWCDLFLRFDRKNYKRAPLMFFLIFFIGWKLIIQ
ncbi:hypothetical protein C2G38_2324121 [Gigaspora rosea]|uniref:Uncharacterized protein n=1 Tax=Gigaspora rosea TaxID=44941 RepID=A0A397UVY0_9GLOM|nr:hypothetical protein C2G38_2324121 [Gigaspora rosea]